MIADLVTKVREMFASVDATVQAGGAPAVDIDLTEEGARIAGWLPYSAYKADERVFINRDALGFVLEVTPYCSYQILLALTPPTAAACSTTWPS